MKKSIQLPIMAAFLAVAAPANLPDRPVAPSHFRLIEPISWLVEDQRGDPQKTAPCGGTNTAFGTPSYVVNEARGGQNLRLKLEETIYHPGYYRVALAVNSFTELPPDPEAVTRQGERGPVSVSGVVQDPPQAPVLADGLFLHRTRPTTPQTFETDIQIPNINCEHCILQVIQFMEEHAFNNPGGYSYHHCAIVKITADPSKPIDTRWPAQRAGRAI